MIRRVLAVAGLVRKGRGPKDRIAALPPPERIPLIQAKLAADALDAFLDLVEREGRIRSQQEDAELRKAAGSILMLTEGLVGRKVTSRDEATSAVAAVIDSYVGALGWGFAAGGIVLVALGAGIGAAVGELLNADAISEAALGIGSLGGAAAAWLVIPKVSRLLLLSRCIKTAEGWV